MKPNIEYFLAYDAMMRRLKRKHKEPRRYAEKCLTEANELIKLNAQRGSGQRMAIFDYLSTL